MIQYVYEIKNNDKWKVARNTTFIKVSWHISISIAQNDNVQFIFLWYFQIVNNLYFQKLIKKKLARCGRAKGSCVDTQLV